MVCIYCSGKTEVYNSRHQKRENKVWRRRKCLNCKAVFTTVESLAYQSSLAVRKNGELSPFSSDKLYLSVYSCLKHRQTAIQDARAIVDTIISKLPELIENGLIDGQIVAKVAYSVLKRYDKPASVQYEAYHPSANL